jgi:hypothetical protein
MRKEKKFKTPSKQTKGQQSELEQQLWLKLCKVRLVEPMLSYTTH